MTLEPAFKILSIDGGGIRGLYSAKILEAFEEHFKFQVADCFDMICGTSTGGLIAIALALGVPAKEISAAYEKNGAVIFPKKSRLHTLLRYLLSGGKYSHASLRAVLNKLLGHRKMGDAQCLLCIPSYSITTAQPVIFRANYPKGSACETNDVLCTEAALATTAAPTYFPAAQVSTPDFMDERFIDGGVYANNPALVGFSEAVRYFVGPGKRFNRLNMLSLDSLNVAAGKVAEHDEAASVTWQLNHLEGVFAAGQSAMTDYIMDNICKAQLVSCDYLRIPRFEVPPEQAKLLTLDNASAEALSLLKAYGEAQGRSYKTRADVAAFFARKSEGQEGFGARECPSPLC